MQLINFILPILSLASTLNASPILAPRAKVPAGVFTVTDFYDSGVPHSLYSYVSFNVQDPSFTAYCTASSSVMPTIATAPFPTRCNKPGVSFGLEYKTGIGYVLTIIHRYNRDQTIDLGTIWVGTDVRTRVNPANPNGNVQYINYPTNFTVPYGHYTEPKKTK
ncbi:hypothetical protein TWF569_002064 [Orbilia oligospora]|uniref:AA1-like domain-containing protein n=1 Tax=Orbilia oligospora TaxID=2813651 RepID=A0A7C8NCG5_ORBOL|nr:hypothetical protein TWF706_000621 [Orbilia oligospora]KAF3090625.1 hypothetical protein TWF102_009285 [Orbilia oligospora]KAF3115535.1 hypothetical protein TWF103_010943 [Orbilia oligospora]KAF3122797.1 hypothetical protein TWF569_002064 [Orbilia oligospora]KAF3125448.1 hypothetical protein TWF703_010986 [Orbilia oligospora]